MIQLQQSREEVFRNNPMLQDWIKKIYDMRTKGADFQIEDLMLKWDSRNEETESTISLKICGRGP